MDNKGFTNLLLAGLLFATVPVAWAAQSTQVAELINQRLSYMKDVAGYKADNHLAIEDLPQEAKVLAAAVDEAQKMGLAGDNVKPFIQAQMDAAKAIQYRYRADWLSLPENGWQPEPLEQVREKISVLSSQILTEISEQLSQGKPFTDKETFFQTLQQTHLQDSDKQRLWQGVQQIQLDKG